MVRRSLLDLVAMSALVSKSNALVRASYRLTLAEQRIVLACLAQLDTRRAMRTTPTSAVQQTENIRITALEYAELYGVDASTAYREIHNGAKRLYERSIKVLRPDGREEHFRWIWGRSTHQRAGYIEISFTPDLAQYVTALRGRFTSYSVDQVRRLRSPNAVRIFELMMQWRATGVARVTVADLRGMLQLTYGRFTDIRRFVLDPAVEQINAHTDFETTWRPIHKGRQVDTIEFSFTDRLQRTLPLGNEARSDEDTEALIPPAPSSSMDETASAAR
jgi:plasmid replication initiation protein